MQLPYKERTGEVDSDGSAAQGMLQLLGLELEQETGQGVKISQSKHSQNNTQQIVKEKHLLTTIHG